MLIFRMSYPLSVILGSIVGFSTGLSGAGGSLLAIPLLIYGLAFSPRDALATSLAATGAACLVGMVPRLAARQVEVRAGTLFALAGMIGAPPGTWFASWLSEDVLMASLAAMMVLVAMRMLQQSGQGNRRDMPGGAASGRLWLMPLVGLLTGFLSGTFGIGCGFVIVPAFVLLAGLPIHRAVGTALLVMGIICTTGAVSYFASGRGLDAPELSLLFSAGAAVGVVIGGQLANRLSDTVLKRVFSSIIIGVAILLVARICGGA